MTYRERRAARAERLRGWADKRKEQAAVVFCEADRYRGDVAFNTQPGHIPERARLVRRRDAACASAEKAAEMEGRAAEIERQAGRAVYDDDPDAVERLEARVAGLEV